MVEQGTGRGTFFLLLPACFESLTVIMLRHFISLSCLFVLPHLLLGLKTAPGFIGWGMEVDKPASEVSCHSLLWLLRRLQWVSMCLISPLGTSERCPPTRACARAKRVGVRRWWLKEWQDGERENGVRVGGTGRREMRWWVGAAVGSVLWQQRGFGSSSVASFFHFFVLYVNSPWGGLWKKWFASFLRLCSSCTRCWLEPQGNSTSGRVGLCRLVVEPFAFLKHICSSHFHIHVKTLFISRHIMKLLLALFILVFLPQHLPLLSVLPLMFSLFTVEVNYG